ncbi:tail assembly protein [Xenorhabdus miraniensis]|uniref:Tail assembly protein n=3 Tax=Xenorhabdus TaxID=626 RepID=A0A2D0JS90_9GAMM|nr:tail assembly protein [Xenorhabdus miraniensis]
MTAKLNKNMIATVAGDITVYNYHSETREYSSTSVEFLPVGVGIPAHSCVDAPGESKEGYAICRSQNLSAWEYVADHRGETVYNTKMGAALVITVLGDYPSDTTPAAPTTAFDKWDGKRWVTDADKKQAHERQQAESEKRQLLRTAAEHIDICQDAVDLDIATDTEKSALIAWRKYRVLLNRVDCATAPDIEWPEQPK